MEQANNYYQQFIQNGDEAALIQLVTLYRDGFFSAFFEFESKNINQNHPLLSLPDYLFPQAKENRGIRRFSFARRRMLIRREAKKASRENPKHFSMKCLGLLCLI